MQNTKVLEMLNNGRIEELKTALQDEIYTESLKKKPNAKKRYSAMKKYFTYISSSREALQMPCEVEFEGKSYISFTNSHSLALTTETCGEMKLFEDKDRYPDVTRLINYSGDERRIDFAEVFANAKSKGYKLRKDEVSYGYRYLLHYDGSYFKVGLLDATFGIIDDGEKATVYHTNGTGRPMTIKTSIGVCIVMPMRIDTLDGGVTVIEI